MGRHIKKIDNRILIYGHDPQAGYFYEIWDYDKDSVNGLIEDGEQRQGITRNEIIEKLEEFDVPTGHVHSIVFNCTF